MKTVEITVNGTAYPCRPTMGAMLRFKRETGREITEIEQGSFSDVCTYLWCCIVSACKHDGIPFDLSLLDFADSLSADDVAAWSDAMQAETAAAGPPADEKKSR